jgi:ATP-dependent DNA helicase PIF1
MKIEVNEAFQKAIDFINQGKNVFITGRAGTGKSTFLQYLCQNIKKNYVLLAPTGVAAVNIGGQTIHSFFRFKPGITVDEAEKRGKKTKSEIYKKLALLIIDEISMVRADLFDCVDVFLRKSRQNEKPFGGVQLLLIGDLYQLPPVVKKNESGFSSFYQSSYFFSSKVMDNLDLFLIEFEKIYRQKDEEFINILNRIRNKDLDEEILEKLNKQYQEDFDEEKYRDYIFLTTRNDQAEAINFNNLEKLPGKAYTFEAEINGEIEEELYPADVFLTLKKGARVMFLNNDSRDRWINGSLGWVVSVSKEKVVVRVDDSGVEEVEPYTWEIIENYFDEKQKKIKKKTIGYFSQYPLKLSWAITIHKSQGKTFDKVVIDIGRGSFTPGQVYVALSRCRSLSGIVLKQPIKKKHIWSDWKVRQFLTNFQYKKSEEIISFDEKLALIKKAVKNKEKLEIVYLKAKDEKSKRVILPKKIYQADFQGHSFWAVEGYCFLREEERVFNVKRIVEIRVVK